MPASIAGTYMDRSLRDFVLACEDCIENERQKLQPDRELILLLEDAIRLARELTLLTTGEHL